uniref:B-like cyclin n=1 Tax=Rhizophora mucronata TaxID=61149 RepID=A0A2P2IKP2_RHIMU
MAGSDENEPGAISPANIQEGALDVGVSKLLGTSGNNRRALSNINQNIIGAPPYPCAVNKRGLSEREAICGKRPPIPVPQPITRKFAAQLANKQPHKLEETKKLHQSVSSESEDCTTIDVEDSSDFSVPMFVQQTESMPEEVDQMGEIEMEDLDEEPVVNIDSYDKKDPLSLVEYVDELYTFYKKAERSHCVPLNYMAQQFDINERMRGILIDWLIEVCKFSFTGFNNSIRFHPYLSSSGEKIYLGDSN